MQVQEAPPPSTDAGDAGLALEEALLTRAAASPEAFGALYDRYVGRVYRYAFRRLGSHQDAEDVTAQTFRRALEALDRFEWRGVPFGAWLFRVAHNQIVDRHRSGGRPLSLDGLSDGGANFEDGDAVAPEQRAIAREEGGAAWAAVAKLPALQRRAVTLRFGRDLSHAEVGLIIGRSEAATKQLVYRAMKTLREELGAE
jgi:RNA polymerase sigma-70 factor (ECF subfamily)